MSEEKRCIIDLREMGDRYGLELVDVVKDGNVILRDHAWNQPALQKAVAECRQRAKGADIVETACVTSLVLMLAGVIPALGGLGTTEGLFILFFSGLTDSVTAASSMLLYRFATYMLPCLAGAVCAIILHRYWSTKGD